MINLFSMSWQDAPIVVIDTETTGVRPGVDKAVSVALVRFEKGKRVDSISSFIDPLCNIPTEASAIHGITQGDVDGMPTIDEFFGTSRTKSILHGAQPAAYNAPFDREFVAREAFEDWSWPWIDPLVFVRTVDRYAKGKGRHTLGAACERHGVNLNGAHQAIHDARAAGELFYKLAPMATQLEQMRNVELGQLLLLQRRMEASQWFEFAAWLSRKEEYAV